MNLEYAFILKSIVPKDTICIILMFVQMLCSKPLSDLTRIYDFPKQYRKLFILTEQRKRETCVISEIILACSCSVNKRQFISEIIPIALHKIHNIETFDQTRALFEKQLTHSKMFFEVNVKNSYLNDMQAQLFSTAIQTDNMRALKLMCGFDDLGQLMCYLADKFNLVADSWYLANLAFEGKLDILGYIYNNCSAYKDIMTSSGYFEIVTGSMHGGFFDFTVELMKLNGYPLSNMRQLFIKALLRCNHLDILERVLADEEFCPSEKMEDILVNEVFTTHSTYRLYLNLPKVTWATIKYLKKHYISDPSLLYNIRNFYLILSRHENIFSDEALIHIRKYKKIFFLL